MATQTPPHTNRGLATPNNQFASGLQVCMPASLETEVHHSAGVHACMMGDTIRIAFVRDEWGTVGRASQS